MPERFLGDWPRDAFIPFSLGTSLFLTAPNHDSRALCRCQGLPRETVRVHRNVTKGGSLTCIFFPLRFFETEGIAVMTTLVSKYRIEVKEEPEFAGETFEERYARITASNEGLTTK